jgi:hypothetical protein
MRVRLEEGVCGSMPLFLRKPVILSEAKDLIETGQAH